MKNLLKLLCVLVFIGFLSCENNSDTASSSSSVTEQSGEKSFPDTLTYITKNYDRVFPECEGEGCTTYNLGYIEITDKAFSFINDSIHVELIGDYASFDDAADEFFDEYQEIAMETESQMPWSHEVNAGVSFNRNGLFTLSYGYYGYMGGAHGMPGFYSVNYDLETKKILSFYDLVNASDSTVLLTLGEKYFRQANKLDATTKLDELGYFWDGGKFYFTDVFTITDDGLMFTYSPYEIASYAAGMPEMTIPFAELKPYLTENSPLKRLME